MAKQSKRAAAAKIVATICLYGTSKIGAGYLATAQALPGKLFGSGEPVEGRSFTEAVWLGSTDLLAALDEFGGFAACTGLVRIFAAGGEFYADAPLGGVPSFGRLQWQRVAAAVAS